MRFVLTGSSLTQFGSIAKAVDADAVQIAYTTDYRDCLLLVATRECEVLWLCHPSTADSHGATTIPAWVLGIDPGALAGTVTVDDEDDGKVTITSPDFQLRLRKAQYDCKPIAENFEISFTADNARRFIESIMAVSAVAKAKSQWPCVWVNVGQDNTAQIVARDNTILTWTPYPAVCGKQPMDRSERKLSVQIPLHVCRLLKAIIGNIDGPLSIGIVRQGDKDAVQIFAGAYRIAFTCPFVLCPNYAPLFSKFNHDNAAEAIRDKLLKRLGQVGNPTKDTNVWLGVANGEVLMEYAGDPPKPRPNGWQSAAIFSSRYLSNVLRASRSYTIKVWIPDAVSDAVITDGLMMTILMPRYKKEWQACQAEAVAD